MAFLEIIWTNLLGLIKVTLKIKTTNHLICSPKFLVFALENYLTETFHGTLTHPDVEKHVAVLNSLSIFVFLY